MKTTHTDLVCSGLGATMGGGSLSSSSESSSGPESEASSSAMSACILLEVISVAFQLFGSVVFMRGTPDEALLDWKMSESENNIFFPK